MSQSSRFICRTEDDGFAVAKPRHLPRLGHCEMNGATDTRSSLEYNSGAEDFVSEAVELYKQRERALGKERFEKLLKESLDDNCIGKTAWYRRIELLEGV